MPPRLTSGDGRLILGVGAVGLPADLTAAVLLHSSAGESLTIEGALLYVPADLMGSITVISASVLIIVTGRNM